MQCAISSVSQSQPADEPGHDVDVALRCLLLSPGADYPREAGKFDPTTTYGGDFKVQYGTVDSQPLPLGNSWSPQITASRFIPLGNS